jgi:hypothetical protein
MGGYSMKDNATNWNLRWGAAAATALTLCGLSLALGNEREPPSLPPVHFTGLLNDFTPSAAVVKGGPYEMRGKWSLDIDERRGTAAFTAAMDMETSDFAMTAATIDVPANRGAHTHHIVMTEGTISTDWTNPNNCPAFSPAVTEGFVVTGPAFVTGNGGPASFGNPTTVTICVLGGVDVKYSNVTLKFSTPASAHFGVFPIHSVVLRCMERWGRESKDCSVDQ